MMMTQQEANLVQQFRTPSGKRAAFAEIVASCNPALYRHLSRFLKQKEDLEDVMQQVWIKIWQGLDNFRGESRLQTWIISAGSNEAISFLRKKRMHLVEWEAAGSPDRAQQPETSSETILLKLEAALQALPEKQKQVFIMRYYEELNYEQMSEQTGTSVGALKASYHHAVKKIQEIITR